MRILDGEDELLGGRRGRAPAPVETTQPIVCEALRPSTRRHPRSGGRPAWSVAGRIPTATTGLEPARAACHPEFASALSPMAAATCRAAQWPTPAPAGCAGGLP